VTEEDTLATGAGASDVPEGTVDATPAADPADDSTWASTGGGLEPAQRDNGQAWPSASGHLEELGKAMTDDE
jgi:hypothetical protein